MWYRNTLWEIKKRRDRDRDIGKENRNAVVQKCFKRQSRCLTKLEP